MKLEVAELIQIGKIDIKFLGRGNIWVDDTLNKNSKDFVQGLIKFALDNTTPGQLELVVYDENLSGIASPFFGLNNSGEKLLTSIRNDKDFEEYLDHLRDHINGVLNVIGGRSRSLTHFRADVDYPIEGYKLIVISADYDLLKEDVKNKLLTLLRVGPNVGVSFLVHSMTLLENSSVLKYFSLLSNEGSEVTKNGELIIGDFPIPANQELIKTSENIAETISRMSLSSISFTDVQSTDKLWEESSVDGLTFCIGRYGLDIKDITLGDELNQRHNILITGAVGQGKSNLIYMVLHSLCQRYSPEELELYLLDFKEGVSLQPFVPDSEGVFLPHAKALGLEADREYGLSVLAHLLEVYKERMATFKDSNVQNLKQYRTAFPEQIMPRILLVIDEFQLMFSENDSISYEIAKLLMKGARLFRAAGIHILLSSQTIGGNNALMGSDAEGLFGQVPIRLALKNSISESYATLGQQNDAAAHLRSREAIVNLDYGNIASNMKTSIAFADELVLEPLRKVWWKSAMKVKKYPFPNVFIGSQKISLSRSNIESLREHNRALMVVGTKVSVSSAPLTLPFDNEFGRNFILFGNGPGIEIIGNISLSLAATSCNSRFLIVDLLKDDTGKDEKFSTLLSILSQYSEHVEKINVHNFEEYLDDVLFHIDSEDQKKYPYFLIILGAERWNNIPSTFLDIMQRGSIVGVHLLLWCSQAGEMSDKFGYNWSSYFSTKAIMRLDSQSAGRILNDPLISWTSQNNRMLVWDNMEMDKPISVIPYSKFSLDL
ncbi:FtsK/SpoIIIE domain-containing protein [Corynebacterium durum]|uniref:FtsK/SpoIIIE domain-containing protein n=1 Tax=Corynebacterium durum TaxID=61592 RepID=UPI0026DCF234|nr:FtsK/SpoIIIE domain-containing protein [Corynebacterium durum]MDO4652376.1 FtsK/SpoIIIE domain-containing protein [Corynebacterium durum]